MRNPHVRFFLQRNGGCEWGEELVCLCPIHPGNFRRRTLAMVGPVLLGGVQRVFALTLVPDFFERVGFTAIRKEDLPMKVWSDCAKCPKQSECDETAVIRTVGEGALPADERNRLPVKTQPT